MGFIKYRSSPTSEWQEIYSIKGDTPIKGVDYFTEEEINDIINEITDNIVGEQVDLGNYYNKTEIDTLIDNVEVDLTDYYNKTEIDNKLADIEAGDVDLSNYYTKTETDTQITNSLTNYATKDYVSTQIENVDLSNYYTKTQTDIQINNQVEAIFSYNSSTGRLDITV